MLHYFAYGSNMLNTRLQRRCPSAKPVCVAFADSWSVNFSKIGRDQSGKATLYPKQNTRCYGVVFTLDDSDLPALDRFEGAGHGYDRMNDFRVQALSETGIVSVITYIAPPQFCNPQLKPFDWYHGLVLAGATEHRLPSDYIASLESVACIQDPDEQRPTHLEAIALLQNIKRPNP